MPRRNSDMSWRFVSACRTGIVFASIAIFVGPIVWFGLQALQPRMGTGTWTWRLDLANFAQLFGRVAPSDYTSAVAVGFQRALLNSIVIALIATIFAIALAIPAGYSIGMRRPL